MNSESEMPLQVSSNSTTPFLLSSMNENNEKEPNVMPESSGSIRDASRRVGAATRGVRPIVLNAVETQNSLKGGNSVRNATCSTDSPIESRHAKIFSEHRKTTSTNTYLDSTEQLQQSPTTKRSPPQQVNDIKDKHPARSRGLNFSLASTEFPITQKTAEAGRNRELHPGFSSIDSAESITHMNRRRTFESHYLQPQQQQALAALPHHPHPPAQYTATAAEIALGITPSYSQNHKIGDGSRVHSMISYTDFNREINRDAVSFQGKETDEDGSRTSASTDSITAMSPGTMTPIHDNASDRIIIGTPSTVSTAPSSDDEALLDYKLDETSTLPNLLHPIHQNQHTFGEDTILSLHDFERLHYDSKQYFQDLQPGRSNWLQQTLPENPQNTPNRLFDGATPLDMHHYPLQQQQPRQRVLSFRSEGKPGEHVKEDENAHQTYSQPLQYQSLPKEHYSSPQHFPHHQPRQQHQQRIQTPQGNRKLSYAYPTTSKTVTPPRGGRNQRQQSNRLASSGAQGSSPHQSSSSVHRSSSEVLKTLLRKKACLYEPNTSRAVSLVTWLVGRLLALEFGFFSRQQLQSGVHACVSNKIEAGIITRTKVNRCMQIILNSCFHYIIPRPDGTEEKGDYFRDAFSETVQDDSLLLKALPEPWDDLVVCRDIVINAILQDVEGRNTNPTSTTSHSPSTSPRHSPKLGSVNAEKNPEKYFSDREKEEASKRAVLLCFNENVRSAEDVFRCHNDFIRDTANASHLQLSAQEWGQFFGLGVLRDPNYLSNVGVSMMSGMSSGRPQISSDILGQMSPDELGKFRTTWCTKRYEHDHNLCGFAHIDVNGGWLRRNPMKCSYKKEMCKFVTPIGNDLISPGNFFLNECPNGVACDHAHSIEEINYHPLNYKNRVCTSLHSRYGGCRLGDVCPNAHPPDSNRPLKKVTSDGRTPDKRGKKNFDPGKSSTKSWASAAPTGAPIVYASPAPISMFERQLGMPGLQNLYRRQSEVVRAYVLSSGKCRPSYSLFGDKLTIPSPSSALK